MKKHLLKKKLNNIKEQLDIILMEAKEGEVKPSEIKPDQIITLKSWDQMKNYIADDFNMLKTKIVNFLATGKFSGALVDQELKSKAKKHITPIFSRIFTIDGMIDLCEKQMKKSPKTSKSVEQQYITTKNLESIHKKLVEARKKFYQNRNKKIAESTKEIEDKMTLISQTMLLLIFLGYMFIVISVSISFYNQAAKYQDEFKKLKSGTFTEKIIGAIKLIAKIIGGTIYDKITDPLFIIAIALVVGGMFILTRTFNILYNEKFNVEEDINRKLVNQFNSKTSIWDYIE